MTFLVVAGAELFESEILHQFNQYLNICKPYISDNEEEKFISEYTQIKNRQDYAQIMEKLHEIAQKNNQYCPRLIIY